MAKYVLVFTGGLRPESEEEQQAVIAEWIGWFASLGQAVIDGGNPFAASGAIAPDGTTSEGAPSGLTGYSILQADDLGAVSELAKSCPHLKAGGSVEVYETIDVM